ncbi:MAG: carbohydrate ABC transporter permease [Lachnospiraceae bacterium]
MMKDTNMLIRRNHKKIKWSRILLWLLIAVLLVWSLFPIYWIVMTSFKTNSATIQKDPTWIPDPFTLEQYKGIFERPTFWSSLFNSFSTSLFATLVSLIVSLLLGYALCRTKMKGKRTILQFVLLTYLIPMFLLFIPIYVLMSQIGLANNIASLYIIYPVTCIPYATWVFVTYLKSIPYSLEEAAMIDGCSRMGIIMKIIIPLAMPGIMLLNLRLPACGTNFCWRFRCHRPVSVYLMVTIKDYMVGDMFAGARSSRHLSAQACRSVFCILFLLKK